MRADRRVEVAAGAFELLPTVPGNRRPGGGDVASLLAALESAVATAVQACASAGDLGSNVGVCIGSVTATRPLIGMSGIPPELSRDHAVAAYVAWRVGATGPAFVVSAACASGTIAVLNGYDLIRSGGASAVVVGGIELVSPELESGYRTMGMISEQPARPFDRSARGAQLASACAFTVLRPATRRRTAPSVIVAHGACVTGRSSEEVGPLVRALASLPGTADVAVFAHGAAVQASDSVEAASIRRARSGAPVVALKGRIGHTLGAAGVLEMILAMRALETGVLPGASSTRDEDVGYDIDLVTTDRRQRVDAVVCSSLGLGGFEAAVVVA